MDEFRKRLSNVMREVIDRFDDSRNKGEDDFTNMFLDCNELIEEAICRFYTDSSMDNLGLIPDIMIYHRIVVFQGTD